MLTFWSFLFLVYFELKKLLEKIMKNRWIPILYNLIVYNLQLKCFITFFSKFWVVPELSFLTETQMVDLDVAMDDAKAFIGE